MKDLKKSVFGALCHSYRSKRQFSIADMAEALERQGYKLGKGRKADTASKPTNHQPLITHYEHLIEELVTNRKYHDDPPMEYVEAVAKLFNLSPSEKHELFVAAINSSINIKLNKVIPKGAIRDVMTSILASLYLGGDMIPMEMSVESKQQDGMTIISSSNKEGDELKLAWDTFVSEANKLSEAIKTNALKLSKTEQNISGEKTKNYT
jgi:hypothetical protein